jgi:hypothetical protein
MHQHWFQTAFRWGGGVEDKRETGRMDRWVSYVSNPTLILRDGRAREWVLTGQHLIDCAFNP